MVLVVIEMVSPELAEYLTGMNIYDIELMVLEYKMNKVLGVQYEEKVDGGVK